MIVLALRMMSSRIDGPRKTFSRLQIPINRSIYTLGQSPQTLFLQHKRPKDDTSNHRNSSIQRPTASISGGCLEGVGSPRPGIDITSLQEISKQQAHTTHEQDEEPP